MDCRVLEEEMGKWKCNFFDEVQSGLIPPMYEVTL